MAVLRKISGNGGVSMVYKSGRVPTLNRETEGCFCLYHESLTLPTSDNENSDSGSKEFRTLKREHKI